MRCAILRSTRARHSTESPIGKCRPWTLTLIEVPIRHHPLSSHLASLISGSQSNPPPAVLQQNLLHLLVVALRSGQKVFKCQFSTDVAGNKCGHIGSALDERFVASGHDTRPAASI